MARYSGLPRVGALVENSDPILAFLGHPGWYEPDDEISGDRVYQAERSTVYVGEYADVLSPQQIDEQLHHLCDEYLPADDHGRRATVDWRQRGMILYAALTEPNLQCVSQYQLLFNSSRMVPVQRWTVIHEFCHVLSIEMTGKGGHGSAFRKALGLVLHGEGRADLMVELERKLMPHPHYVSLEIDNAMVGVVEDAFKLHPGEGSWT
jgi:hypothetical protein